ncbi:hypothetical protein COLO4_32051 [Corchorus olitorius]|uniref:Uncharacterized protein n=1 Tax=Corchorus olitorius TaxID=93759 RepID=A0A1R3H283_9ROSI|nr:hypothetical protein COLO4_32051 [Corchorus olitorius]
MAQIDIQMIILTRPPMMMVPIQAIAWSAKSVISLATRLSSVIEARNSLHLRLNPRQTLLIHPQMTRAALIYFFIDSIIVKPFACSILQPCTFP